MAGSKPQGAYPLVGLVDVAEIARNDPGNAPGPEPDDDLDAGDAISSAHDDPDHPFRMEEPE